MSAISSIGGLLSGITDEAHNIHQERFQQRQADSQMATRMLEFMMSDPNQTDPNIKSMAAQAYRDLVLEQVFPDQFKRDKQNPLHKLVDQFIGMQGERGPALQNALAMGRGEGAGRGKAQSIVGGAAPPASQGPPPQMPLQPGQVPEMPDIAPPAMQTAQPPGPPPSIGGYVSPFDMNQYNVGIEDYKVKHKNEIETEEKLKMVDMLMKDKRFESLRKTGLMNEMIYKIMTGASPVGSTRSTEGDVIPAEQAAAMLGDQWARFEVPGATHYRIEKDPRTQEVVGAFPAPDPQENLLRVQQAQRAYAARAQQLGIPVEQYVQKNGPYSNEIYQILAQTMSPDRVFNRPIVVQQADGSSIAINMTGTSTISPMDFSGGPPAPPAGLTGPPTSSAPKSAPPLKTSSTTPGASAGGRVVGGRPPSPQQLDDVAAAAVPLMRMRALKQAIASMPADAFGPIIGRIEEFQARKLGGTLLGGSEEEKSALTDLAILMDSTLAMNIFSLGGKQLTATEVAMYSRFFPQLRQNKDFALRAAGVEEKRLEDLLKVNIDKVPEGSRGGGVDQSFKDLINYDKPAASKDIKSEFEKWKASKQPAKK